MNWLLLVVAAVLSLLLLVTACAVVAGPCDVVLREGVHQIVCKSGGTYLVLFPARTVEAMGEAASAARREPLIPRGIP